MLKAPSWKMLLRLQALFMFFILAEPVSTPATSLTLQAEKAVSRTYISKVKWQGHNVWIKGVEKYKQSPWHCFKKKLVKWCSPKAIFTPTVACGADILAIEKRRLLLFQRQGIRVPALIADGETWLALEDMGINLQKKLRQAAPAARLTLLFQALESLKELHDKNLTHGRGMVKDMVVTPSGRIGFIDLAEDPLLYMSLAEAQARDFLLFLFSALPFIRENSFNTYALIAAYMGHAAPSVKDAIKETLAFLKYPYKFTRPFYDLLKFEGQRALDTFEALDGYFKASPLAK